MTRFATNAALGAATGGIVDLEVLGAAGRGAQAAGSALGTGVGMAARAGSGVLNAAADGADGYNRARGVIGSADPTGQGAAAAARMGGDALSALARGISPTRSAEEIEVRKFSDMRRDIGRGRLNANIEMSIVSIPMGEIIEEAHGSAGREEVRRQRIPNNRFAGRAGRGYEASDEGKAISLAIIDAYTDMVTRLGGLGDTTPEVTLMTREVLSEAADARGASNASADAYSE